MDPKEMKARTMKFGLQTVRFVEGLPIGKASDIMGRQLLRSSTGTGANYRAACRAKSKADFVNKIQNAEEEADESAYWLEMLIGSGIVSPHESTLLLNEANELTAIFTASGRTAKDSLRSSICNPKSAIRNHEV